MTVVRQLRLVVLAGVSAHIWVTHGPLCGPAQPLSAPLLQVQRRELQAALDSTQEQLQARRELWRRMHLQQQTLQHRISSATHSALAAHTPPSQPQPTAAALMDPPQPHPTCMPSEPPKSHITCVESDIGTESQFGLWFQKDTAQYSTQKLVQLVQRSAPRDAQRDGQRPSRRAISSFKHHASISFDDVTKYMSPLQFRSSCQLHFQELRHAIGEYQCRVAETLDTSASDICWFLEWPCAQFEKPVSHTASIVSPECHLSATAAHITTAMESLFLIMEYEQLASASLSSYEAPEHPTLDASSPPPVAPSPPNRVVLDGAYLCCGVNHRMPAEQALRSIMEPLLEKFRLLLPHDKWLSVCMQSMRVGQAVADALHNVPAENRSLSVQNCP